MVKRRTLTTKDSQDVSKYVVDSITEAEKSFKLDNWLNLDNYLVGHLKAKHLNVAGLTVEGLIDLTWIGVGNLDNIDDGTLYAKLLSTEITAGYIQLTERTYVDGSFTSDKIPEGAYHTFFGGKSLDDLGDGTHWKKVHWTQMSEFEPGKIRLSARGFIIDENGVRTEGSSRMDMSYLGLQGYHNNELQVELSTVDGHFYAAGGDVVLDEDGITVCGGAGRLSILSSVDGVGGTVGCGTNTYTGTGYKMWIHGSVPLELWSWMYVTTGPDTRNFIQLKGDGYSINDSNLYGGTVVYNVTTSGSISTGMVCFCDSGTWLPASNADEYDYERGKSLLGVAVVDGTQTHIVLVGYVRAEYGDLNYGEPLYLGVDGEFSETAPSLQGELVRMIGYSYGDKTIVVNPSSDWMVLGSDVT